MKANKLVGSVDTGYGDGSKFRRDLDRLLAQVNDMTRSVRVLTDLLGLDAARLARLREQGVIG